MEKQKICNLPKFIMILAVVIFIGTLFGVTGYYLIKNNEIETQQVDKEELLDDRMFDNSEDDDIGNEIDISDWKIYRNEKYGFEIILLEPWKGYKVFKESWNGTTLDGNYVEYEGPKIIIRNLKWSEDEIWQDIPVLVFTKDEWQLIEANNLNIFAAPIAPEKLGENNKYVFALPPRWIGFTDALGQEEAQEIIGTFEAFEKDTELFSCGNSTVKDIDNNIYNTVKIGEQCWMKENLKVTKNPSGEKITRYCYDNDESICETDGGLYDWNTAMNGSTEEGAQGICPNGWHVPEDKEWYILESGLAADNCLSTRYGPGCDMAGTKLKTGGANDFDGVLAGGRTPTSSVKGSHDFHYSGGDYYDQGKTIYLWSSNAIPYPGNLKDMSPIAIYRSVSSSRDSVERSRLSVLFAFSIRCLKD